MKSRKILQFGSMALLVVIATLGPVFAQTNGNSAGGRSADYPVGRVVRVQYVLGEVSVAPGGTNDWFAAALNRPLVGNTHIWSDKNSRAEINVGDGFIRMNSETSLTLTNVGRGTVQFQVHQGSVSLTVLHLQSGELYEIDTPNTALTVMKPGVYRVDVYANDERTSVTVRQGSLAATGQGSAVTIRGGEQVQFRNGYSMQHTSEEAPPPDGFDDWATVRNRRLGVPQRVPGSFGIVGFGPWGAIAIRGPIGAPPPPLPVWAPYPYPR